MLQLVQICNEPHMYVFNTTVYEWWYVLVNTGVTLSGP